MTTTLPAIMPSLTPTSSPTRESSTYNDNSLLSLNSSQNITPISSFLNTNNTPITPDSCSSSSFTTKLPKIKLVLKLPPSTSPKERSGSKSASAILHKPINIPHTDSPLTRLNKSALNDTTKTAIMIDEIMNTLFDTTEKLLRNKNGDGNTRKTRKLSSSDSSKSKTKTTKLRKVRTSASKIKKTPVKTSPTKKVVKKKQISEETKGQTENSISDINTIVPNYLSETEIKKDESVTSSITAIPNEESVIGQTNTSIQSSPKSENNESSQAFKLKKIKFIYNPNGTSEEENTNNETCTTENGKRKRKSGNQKAASPKKKREVVNNNTDTPISKNLFSDEKEESSSHPIIHLKVSNSNDDNEAPKENPEQTPKKRGRKRASPTKKTTRTTKTKKANETVMPTNQRSPPQRSPKAQPQTKSYQMSKLDRKNNSNYTPSSSPKSTFKLNLSYTPSYMNQNDGSRFNSYLSSFKQKPSYVHSPLTNSFTFDQTQNSIPANKDYVPSKLNISTTLYDPNNYKIKTQISPTNKILNNNLLKSKTGKKNTSKSKKEKISIIDVLKRESELFTSSSKKLHSKSSISSYYGRPSRRRYSSYVDEAKVKPISIHSNTSSIISTKSIITSPQQDNSSIYKPDLKTTSKIKNEPNARVKSFSTPASPKNLSDDSLRTKAHSYIQRSLTSCKSLTEKFEFHSILGYGSNGVVLGARRRSDNLDVAIKYIYKTPSSRICEEVNILREVSPHPAIIRYIDSFEDNNCIYLVTEKSGSSWVQSEDSNQILTCESSATGRIVLYSTTCNTSSLFDYIELNGCVPPPEQKRMFKAIAEAVYALHSRNIVHGDIKEENILIDSHHNPKLCDFGHARHIGNNAPPHFAVYGTLELSAPELMPNLNVPAHLTKTHVVKRYNGMAQDIWALGLVLYTMTHGELPLNHSKVISKEIDLTSNKYKEYPCSYNRNLSKGKRNHFQYCCL